MVDARAENGSVGFELRLSGDGREVTITSGELGSLMEIGARFIPETLDRLDLIARTIAERVNDVHRRGYNLDGVSGTAFFARRVSGAADFAMNPEVLRDPSLIAASNSPDGPGDGSIAQAVCDIRSEPALSNGTISDFYNALISRVGSRVQQAHFSLNSQELVVESLQNQRDAVSAVSLDEEMTRLIEYEQAYQASARMIDTVNSLVDTILNIG